MKIEWVFAIFVKKERESARTEWCTVIVGMTDVILTVTLMTSISFLLFTLSFSFDLECIYHILLMQK